MPTPPMTAEKPRTRMKGRVLTAVLGAVAIAGLAVGPAQAATWTVRGNAYVDNGPVARADIANTEAKCRAQDGTVVSSAVALSWVQARGVYIYWAEAICQSKRG